MKQTFISLFLVICFSLNIYGQKSSNIPDSLLQMKIAGVSFAKDTAKLRDISINEFDHNYFVLGTLSDYMGRFRYVNKQGQVDRYYPYEEPMTEFLTNYIKKNLNIEVETKFEKTRHSEMYSESLSKTLNSFYGTDEKLMSSSFNTKEQINSFLSGVYYRNGEKLDSTIYKIQLANSPKHQNCYDLLKRIGCHKIFYKYLRNIPAQFILYFEPTEELKAYFNAIESERLILKKSHAIMIGGIMNKDLSETELLLQELREEEFLKIREMFK